MAEPKPYLQVKIPAGYQRYTGGVSSISIPIFRLNPETNSAAAIRANESAEAVNKIMAFGIPAAMARSIADAGIDTPNPGSARGLSHRHEAGSVARYEELLADIGALIPDPSYFDYEFLYGVRRDLQRDMKNKDFRVRIYVRFGSDWLPYTLRRLREWKNFKFVATNIFLELTNPVKKAIFKYK